MGLLFADAKDLVGIKKTSDINYMRVLKLGLKVIFCYPHIEGELQSKYVILGKIWVTLLSIATLSGQILYLYHKTGKIIFLKLGHTYITTAMNSVVSFRIMRTFLKSYNEIMNDFMIKIHIFNHKDRSEYALKIQIIIHKASHFVTVFLNSGMIFAIITFNIAPLYNNYRSGAFNDYKNGNASFEHSVFFYIPEEYENNIIIYTAIFISNWYVSLMCAMLFIQFDLILCLMIINLWGRFKILIHSLETFGESFHFETFNNTTQEGFTVNQSTEVNKKLEDIITHHQVIIKFTSKLSSTFGPVLLHYYIFHIVTLCILLLECSKMDPDALTRYGILTFLVVEQLIQVSVAFEILETMSSKLEKAVYYLPWECMNVSQRRVVLIMLMQAQRGGTVKALDMVNVGVQTMAAILRTSFSYFIMLQALEKEES
ncbi:uncharacterized protein LOC116771534 isoform X1 [Danaus plexippus]|uniref:uncharacterized protein LOC116771534 isoform X1 n=2 Tax=Danaus plexippus TaxID=13037 RepID=UPI002AAFA2EF|nr:uncharacterized protein LOC116771534 isoform X1 [Danaus plexippus]